MLCLKNLFLLSIMTFQFLLLTRLIIFKKGKLLDSWQPAVVILGQRLTNYNDKPQFNTFEVTN